MSLLVPVAFLLFFSSSTIFGMGSDEVERSELCSKEVPPDPCTLPELKLDERFGACGEKIELGVTKDKPETVKFPDVGEDEQYVLVMVDPDVPSYNNPVTQLWKHWVVAGISGEALSAGTLDGFPLTSYMGPTPPPGKVHRYNFYLFKQTTEKIIGGDGSSRAYFNLADFMEKNNLCTPEAGFQFKTETLNK
ncbi:protein D2 isoform X1 [Lingula anatina]|uniref:Protein D2 isoform X1 n=1 Tax=Lingula anatina TaxID=7574 RepID=A0A1S3HCC2_LINAN|nr:protein D2 isoform X1 [Lingula anatina]|eukprot:XP_013383161.1 protein D2 isoform X1 [Lingula anatina]